MTRSEVVNLRVGQRVRTKHAPGRFFKITKIYVPKGGCRVIELDNRLWVGSAQIEEVLAA